MTRRDPQDPQVYGITGARQAHSEDLDQRVTRYLISMAIRTACVLLVFVVHGPLRWLFAAGAILLPYVAVVLANAGGRRRGVPGSVPVEPRGLGSGPGPAQAGPVVLTGIVETPRQRPDHPDRRPC